ncbi:hypothetical protein ElyMa_003598100 [Elysia marginata]|uniref:Uncharacterized protein n=1 Tax=Elysia marginata TaxID=1093978 RepID=A0AAV4EQS9_9GAST|nr:hypothetical protein ElyMa_003598100 [Elysia marginata]
MPPGLSSALFPTPRPPRLRSDSLWRWELSAKRQLTAGSRTSGDSQNAFMPVRTTSVMTAADGWPRWRRPKLLRLLIRLCARRLRSGRCFCSCRGRLLCA